MSGRRLERPGLGRLRTAIAGGEIDIRLASDLGHLARDDTALSQILDEWVRAGCWVVFTDQG